MQLQRSKQSGFTLIEIAIVLVIIGLLLGGVLKGQEMIENGKVKAAVRDIQGIQAAMNSYKDRYKALPGDDVAATTANRGAGWPGAPVGNGDGLITGATAGTTFTATGNEAILFWRDLRAAGFLNGNPAVTTVATGLLPQNPFGGLEGIAQGTAAANVLGQTGVFVCMNNIPGKDAAAIDNLLDDGLPATGTVRALQTAGNPTEPSVGAPAAATGYNETLTFTVCAQIAS